MASEQLNLTRLIEAVCNVLDAFNVPTGASLIKRAAANRDSQSNNTQLLINLKHELVQLPSLTSSDMNSEMRYLIQALVESIKATGALDKKFLARFTNKIYHAFEPFARNELQHKVLIDMQIAKEDVLNVELRHRVAHRLAKQSTEGIPEQKSEHNEDLHMTRELRIADYWNTGKNEACRNFRFLWVCPTRELKWQ